MGDKWPAIKAGNLNRALNKALIQKLIAGTAAGICLTGTPRGKRDIIIYIQQSERNGLQQQASRVINHRVAGWFAHFSSKNNSGSS
jgi:hypothetical protein